MYIVLRVIIYEAIQNYEVTSLRQTMNAMHFSNKFCKVWLDKYDIWKQAVSLNECNVYPQHPISTLSWTRFQHTKVYTCLFMRGETWGDYEYSNNTSKVNYSCLWQISLNPLEPSLLCSKRFECYYFWSRESFEWTSAQLSLCTQQRLELF